MLDLLKKTIEILKRVDDENGFGPLKLSLIIFLISVVEVVSVGVLLPYLKMIVDGDASVLYLQYNLFNVDYQLFITFFSVLLVIFFIVKSLFQYHLYRKQYDYIFDLNKKLSLHLAKSYMSMAYGDFIRLNNSTLIKNITQEVIGFVQGILLPLVVFFTELFVAIMMFSMLVYINFSLISLVALILAPIIIYIHYVVKKEMSVAGNKREESQNSIYCLSEELLGSYKEVYIYNSLSNMLSYFNNQLDEFKKTSALFQLYNQLPRIIIEAAVFSFFVILAVASVQLSYGISEISEILIFGIALVRILPSVNRINSALVRIKYYVPSCEIIFKAVSENRRNSSCVDAFGNDKIISTELNKFESLELIGISYLYERQLVINNAGLVINKGDKIAVIGGSGAGKSTLIDIVSGFLEANKEEGVYCINGQSVPYRKYVEYIVPNISLVSQSNFFYDDTLRNNIILNAEDRNSVDDSEVIELLIRFGLEELRDELNNGVGQKSIKLSGGQKQRIAIVRALLAKKEILILDEATSAIDSINEEKILSYISEMDRTVISITHNLNNLEYFDIVMVLSKGKIVELKPYSDKINYKDLIL